MHLLAIDARVNSAMISDGYGHENTATATCWFGSLDKDVILKNRNGFTMFEFVPLVVSVYKVYL
jgi:hypothetical protein